MKKAILLAIAGLMLLVFSCQKENPVTKEPPVPILSEGPNAEWLALLSAALLKSYEEHPEVLLLTYQEAVGGVDEYYYVPLNGVIEKAQTDLEINFYNTLDSWVSTLSGEEKTLSSLYEEMGVPDDESPGLFLPYLHLAFPDGTISGLPARGPYSSPQVGFITNETCYPAPGVSVSEDNAISVVAVEKTTAKAIGYIMVTSHMPDHCLVDGDMCHQVIEGNCVVRHVRGRACPSVPPGNVPNLSPGPGGLFNYELELNVGIGTPSTSDDAYDIDSDMGGWFGSCPTCRYARLTALDADFYFYSRTTSGGTIFAERLIPPALGPIQGDDGTGTMVYNGNVKLICDATTAYTVLAETNTGLDGMVGSGGVYKLERPMTNLAPLYFAIPFSKFLWFDGGNDLRIKMDHTLSASGCPPNPLFINHLNENYYTDYCEFCSAPMSQPSPNSTRYIVTTNASDIINYWKDNTVTVGFTTSTPVQASNQWHFYATTGGPATPLPHCSLIGELVKSPVSAKYEILKPMISPIPSGGSAVLHTYATFTNGERVDDWRVVTLATAISSYYTLVGAFTGKIVDYHVEVFEIYPGAGGC